jgi:hypothetical protein
VASVGEEVVRARARIKEAVVSLRGDIAVTITDGVVECLSISIDA